MDFLEDKSGVNYVAYSNVVKVCGPKMGELQMNYTEPQIKEILRQIYNIFVNLTDFGNGYSRMSVNDERVILFKEGTYRSPGNITISVNSFNTSIETSLTSDPLNRDYVSVRLYDGLKVVDSIFKNHGGPMCTIKGETKTDTLLLKIVDEDNVYTTEDNPYHAIATLANSVMPKKEYEDLISGSKYDVLGKIKEYLRLKSIELTDKDIEFITNEIATSTDLDYSYDRLNEYFIRLGLREYLSHKNNKTSNSLIPINADEISIEKFKKYEVLDEYNNKVRLIDIPLYLLDNNRKRKCPFLDALNKVKDIDVYTVGLAYFASYCKEFGPMSGFNLYGGSFYTKMDNEKLNTAIKSKVLGLPIEDYAIERLANKEDMESPVMQVVLSNLGFDIKDQITNEQRSKTIDTTRFKELLPNLSPSIEFNKYTY